MLRHDLAVSHDALRAPLALRCTAFPALRIAMSPYRQAAFRGAFNGYLFHGARRLATNAPYFVPPFAIGEPARAHPRSARGRLMLTLVAATPAGYAVYTWAKAKDHYYNSKQAHIDALKSGGEHHGH